MLFAQVYCEVSRLWKPAECCPQCHYANDRGFQFCQRCDFRKQIPPALLQKPLAIPISSIKSRLQSLRSTHREKPYERQKSSLQQKLEVFLASLPSPRTFVTASPDDLIRILIWKNKSGKTRVHRDSCPFFGSSAKRTACPCSTRLAAGTVDNWVAKLKALYSSLVIWPSFR